MTYPKQAVEAAIPDFIKEFTGKFTIWGVAVGAGPKEYDEFGKPRHRSLADYQDYALHVYIQEEAFRDSLPETYLGVPVMVFCDVREEDGHQWSGGDTGAL